MSKAVAAAVLSAAGLVLGVTLALLVPQPESESVVEWLENPRKLSPFQLETGGMAFSDESLNGHWTIILFGFLNCPDICPTTLSRLAAVAQGLPAQSVNTPLRYVFISVDPQRDAAPDVARYARHFHPDFAGATGTQAELTQLAGELGVRFDVFTSADHYEVAHSATLSVIDPSGRLHGRFRSDFDATILTRNLVERIRTL